MSLGETKPPSPLPSPPPFILVTRTVNMTEKGFDLNTVTAGSSKSYKRYVRGDMDLVVPLLGIIWFPLPTVHSVLSMRLFYTKFGTKFESSIVSYIV